MKPIVSALAAVLVIATPALASATNVAGAITSNTTWTPAGNPWVMTGDVFVNAGVTLTIEPGVEVRASIAGGDTELIVRGGGTLVADASAGTAIRFTADTGTTPGSWEGLLFESGAAATLKNVRIEYADYAVEIAAADATHVIDGVEIVQFATRGINLVSCSAAITLRGVRANNLGLSGGEAIYANGCTSLLVDDSVLVGGSRGVHALNSHVLIDHTVIDGAATDGVRVQRSTTGNSSLELTYSTVLGCPDAIEVNRASSSSYALSVAMENSIFGNNTYILRDTSSSSYPVTFSYFRRNVWWGGGQWIGPATPISVTDNLNYDALLADPASGNYEPTDRSPARYFAPASPAQTLGAIPHAGTSTGAGVHGFWYVNRTFGPGSVTDVAGDMIIAAGATVTFQPDARFRVATTDRMGGGLDPNKVEIRVEGTLEADGTISRPVRFTSAAATPARGDWYGIVIPANAEAFNVSQVELGYAYRGVSLYANDHIVAGSTIHNCSNAGIHIEGGTPSVEDVILRDNARGIYAQGATDLALVGVNAFRNDQQGLYATTSTVSWTGGLVYDNGGDGIYANMNQTGTRALTFRNLTIAHNGQQGIEVNRSSSSSYALSLSLTDVSVSHNSSYGVYDSSSTSYPVGFSCARSNAWGNGSSNYTPSSISSVWSSGSCFSYNPLYADATARDYAPTKYSPNRGLGTAGAHVGAVPYEGDLGPQIMGWIWDDLTFTAEGSPYTILGDIVVPPGRTLTVQPGARLLVARRADGMGGGRDQAETEILFQSGSTGTFVGTGAPSVITVDALVPLPGDWDGVYFEDSGLSAVDNVRVEWAEYGFHVTGPTAPTFEDCDVRYSSLAGIYATGLAGSTSEHKLDVLACSIIGTGSGTGIDVFNVDVDIRSSYITHTGNGIYARATVTGTWDLYAINNTIVHQGTGILLNRASSSSYQLVAQLHNNVVAASTSYAIRDTSSSSYPATTTLRNNNLFGVPTTGGTFSSNIGTTTTNPLVEDDDWDPFPRWWDGKLWAESPAIDQGYASAPRLPSRDRLGSPRTIGTNVDVGAFEFDPAANREPRADGVTASIMVPRGESFTFDGSAAFDPDGTIASAWWTMSDGTVSAGRTVTHTFATEGTGQWGYITVVDDDGAEDHAKVDVNVNVRPIAEAGPAVFQDAGAVEPVFFDGTLSYDPDGTIASWRWDFGDGSPISNLQSPRHSYASAGTYVVTLTVTDNEGLTHSDTTLATVFGVVDDRGPLVLHTEVADGRPLGSPVLVSARITDPSGVAYAFLFYRRIGDTAASFLAMTNTAGETYEAIIPGTAVVSPGVEYWIQTADGADPQNDSTYPIGAPATAVWDFLVTGDPDPPAIAHTEIADGQANGTAVAVNAQITDATGVGSANLYFRTTGAASFGAVAMTRTTGNNWTAQIPGFVVAPPGVQYYIQATDTSPIPNTALAPAGAPSALFDFTVRSSDTVPPIIAHTPVANGQPAGSAILINAGIADSGGSVASAAVHYRTAGSTGAFTAIPMTRGTGTNWSVSIPGAAVVAPGVQYYVSATDDSANTATDPAGAPTSYHAFTVSAVDTAGPTVEHTRVPDGQPSGVAVVVTATANDPSGVDRVQLRYRPTGYPIFSTVDMTTTGGGVYQGSIPGFSVTSPSVQYYLRAFDTRGNETRVPANGDTSPYTFTVVSADTTPPVIAHTPITAAQTAGEAVRVTMTVTDASAITATLYHRADGAPAWTALTMTNTSGTTWEATIPALAVAAPSVEYYVHARDVAGNQAAHPAAAPLDWHEFDVVAPDLEGPTIVHTRVAGPVDTGTPVEISAVVFDPSGLDQVVLEYRALETGAWSSVAMSRVASNTYAATIPAPAVVAPGVDYYIWATDAAPAANESSAPAAGAAAPYSFAVAPPDTTGPTITHTPITSSPAGSSLSFSATVSDPAGVASASVHWRAGAGSYATLAMTGAAGTWSAVLPWSSLPSDATSVSYYLRAVDSLGNATLVPVTAPTTGWNVTIVRPDTTGPAIDVPPVPTQTVGVAATIPFTVSDPGSGVSSVVFEYRAAGASSWISAPVSGSEPNYSATIPGPAVVLAGLQVRVTARDGVSNETVSPIRAIAVAPAPDLSPPSIELPLVPDGQSAGVDLQVSVLAADADSGVAAVSFFYRTAGQTTWNELALSELGPDEWTGTLPGAAVALPAVEYWARATDAAAAANLAVAPEGAPTAFETFSVTPADTAGPSIAHTPPALPIYAGDSLVLTTRATDPSGVATVSAWWRNAAGAFVEAPMTRSDGLWRTAPITVPARATFDYYLRAVDTNTNAATDPATAPVAWRSRPVSVRDLTPPSITHTPVANGRPVNAPVAVSATISDDVAVASATLHYRVGASGPFTSIAMASAAGEFSAVIPSAAVTAAGVQYYLHATDTSDNAATSPEGAPTAVHAFTVGATSTDSDPPVIGHTPVVGPQAASAAVALSAVVVDATGVAEVAVYFRLRGTTDWLSAPLSRGAGSNWAGAIPALVVAAPGVDYYLRAVDASSARNAATDPATAPGTFHTFDVTAPDTAGPSITLVDPTGPFVAGTPITLAADITDPSGVASATLHFAPPGAGWQQRTMAASGARYSATIPAESVTAGELRYYVVAADVPGNVATAPAGGAATPETILVDPGSLVDDLPPTLLHSPVSASRQGRAIALTAVATDASGIASVTLWVRPEGGDWSDIDASPAGTNSFAAEIPAELVVEPGLEYYLVATDGAEPPNEASSPENAPDETHYVEVFGDSDPDAGDVGGDTGPDAGDDTGTDAGNDTGTDAGDDAGDDAGADSGEDTADAGADVGADADSDAETDFGTDADPDAATGIDTGTFDLPDTSGCGCTSTSGRGAPVALAAMLALLALRRRAPRRPLDGPATR